MIRKTWAFRSFCALVVLSLLVLNPSDVFARSYRALSLSARSAVIMDANSGKILFSKNPHLRLSPASTTKVMTALIALEKLRPDAQILVGKNAVNMAPSKAGLVAGTRYRVADLVTATLVSSSNDAAVALAEAVSGRESDFAQLMNEKAAKLGMKDTHFMNATGLPVKKKSKKNRQYSTAYDLSRLMWYASRDRRIDHMMAVTNTVIRGSDGRTILLRNHNKMLWKTPGSVKGKTGWTFASRHTFMGTNYASPKMFTFAMLSSTDPWIDIKRLANLGTVSAAKNRFSI